MNTEEGPIDVDPDEDQNTRSRGFWGCGFAFLILILLLLLVANACCLLQGSHPLASRQVAVIEANGYRAALSLREIMQFEGNLFLYQLKINDPSGRLVYERHFEGIGNHESPPVMKVAGSRIYILEYGEGLYFAYDTQRQADWRAGRYLPPWVSHDLQELEIHYHTNFEWELDNEVPPTTDPANKNYREPNEGSGRIGEDE